MTTLWGTYLNLSWQKAKIYYSDHSRISKKHIKELAELFGVSETEINRLIDEDKVTK